MQKKFITNLAFLLFLNILVKPFWIFGIDRTVQNIAGADVYGHYFVLFNFSFLFNMLLDLGITNYNNRNISQHGQLVKKHFSAILLLRILLACIYLFVSFVIALFLGYKATELSMLLVLLLNQILISFILYLRSNIAGLQYFKTDSVISILDRTIVILICSFLLWGNFSDHTFKIEWFIWAQTFSYAITFIIAFIIVARKASFEKLLWNTPFFMLILRQSFPYALLALLMTFAYKMDSIMLERLLPDGALQAGIYAQSYRLLDASVLMGYLFAGLLLPMFAHMIGRKENVEHLVRLSFSLIMVPAVSVAACAVFFKTEIMQLLYHAHVIESAPALGLLMITFTALCSSYIFGTLLTANGNLKELNLIAGASMVLNITLNFILIPSYKVSGAAISCLCTQMFASLIQILIAKNKFKFHFNKNFFFGFLIFITTCFSSFYFIKMISAAWMIQVIAAFIICLLFSFALRIISLKELKEILRTVN